MELTFTAAQVSTMLTKLGLPADTDNTEMILACIEDVCAQVAELDPEKPSTVAAAAKRAGLEVVDTDMLTALRHDAQEGRKIAAAAKHADIERQVDEAVSAGKITAARKKHWQTLLEADPGMAEVLASVPNETAVPMTELGHSLEPVDAGADKPAWFY